MAFLPKQTAFVVGNEACERFSFYGMKGILALYITNVLMMSDDHSLTINHTFTALVYFTPLLGAWLADRVLGRYKTILYVSLLYCLGHGILALSDLFNSTDAKFWVLFAGLGCIGFGAGGIKPCVSSFMGDQITDKSAKTMTRAYNAFYWSINLGSLLAFLVIPSVKNHYGYGWAFGIPGIFMGLATFIFWLGRHKYILIPPQKAKNKQSFWAILSHICFKGGSAKAKQHFDAEKVDEVLRVLRIVSLFIFVIPFWAIFDQTNSSWVIVGSDMASAKIPLPFIDGSWTLDAEKLQAANPAFVMILIPFISVFIYPYIGKFGRPLFRMCGGIFLAAISFLVVAWLKYRLDQGEMFSVLWMLLPYAVLTIGEIFISTTGLEFAYTQAPPSMKSVITSFWNLTIAFGNLLVVAVTHILTSGELTKSESSQAVSTTGFITYAALAIVVGVCFAFSARSYMKHA